MNKKIDLMKVAVPPEDVLLPVLKNVLYSGFISEGQQVKSFEEKFQEKFRLSVRPLSVNSGTAALQLAYRCCNVKNKIVLTTPMTCYANVCAILNEGGKIVWCDIDPLTGNISAKDVLAKVESYGRSNIAAISFVDLAGYPADISALVRISHDYTIPLIEDAAQALGAKWDGRYVGSAPNYDFDYQSIIDHYVAYSFQAIKHLTTVDGGMLVINQEYSELNSWDLAKRLKWFGINREAVKEETRWLYDIPDHGYKFHMNNVNAAIGLEQLNYIDSIIQTHKDNGKWFDENLKNISGLKLVNIPKLAEPSYWIYPVLVERKEDFAKMMKSKGIATNIAHVRNDSYSSMKNPEFVLNHTEVLPGMDLYEKEYIFIPCGWWVSSEDRTYIAECIKGGW